MKTFLIWNDDKIDQYLNIEGDLTAVKILKAERKQGHGCSSLIQAINSAHALRLCEAFYNETDTRVSLEILPDNLRIAAFNTSHYNSFAEAEQSGAVYTMLENVSFDQLLNERVMADICAIIRRVSFMFFDEDKTEVVVIDTAQPEKMYAHLHDFI